MLQWAADDDVLVMMLQCKKLRVLSVGSGVGAVDHLLLRPLAFDFDGTVDVTLDVCMSSPIYLR